MMEEGSGLESLIKQRLTRPSYTRMVSWEFSNQQEVKPVNRKRRRSKRQSNVEEEAAKFSPSSDENEMEMSISSIESHLMDPSCSGQQLDVFSSDDDCLYFSAEENLSSADSDISQGVTSLAIQNMSSNENFRSKESNIVVRKEHPEKKHAPSKKQKRKRRKHDYTVHVDEILQLLEVDIEPDIIRETREIVEGSLTCVDKAVPSLVELCLNCTRQRNFQIPLPKGLKNMVKTSNQHFTFRKFQVSRLQNDFAEWQPFEDRKGELFYCYYDDGDDWGSHDYKCLLPARNIWNSVFFPKFLSSHYSSEYACSKTSSILPFTFVTNSDVWENNYDAYSYVFHQRFLGSFATLVDLMMPAVFGKRNIGVGNEYTSESEQIMSATKTAMGRVKGALKVRFADITDRFFDKVTPYVFWARGDLQQASALFTKLIDGEKRSRYRAMYMTEIARMHAQLGQPDLACRFYRMASDIALEKGKAMINDQEVTGQQFMLLASVYDQGMMTANNNRSAADHWKYVVTSKTFNQGAANMAVISMLCFHSRPGNGTKPSSFVEAKRRLETMVDKNPKYQYYLSMLQALSGQGSDADNTYRAFLQRENADGTQDPPGRRMVSSPQTSGVSRKQKNNVWHALSTMITRSGLPQPLHVLWRSHLQPLRVCDPTRLIPPSEADLCCDNLDLRLNSEGYLTGNMKTLLPPMRSINLDPYTGKLCFPQIPGRTEPWTSLDRFCSSSLMFDSFDNGCIPCPVEVYRDKDGTTIQMMLPTSLKNFGNSNWTKSNQAALTFFWSNGKGESAKLNVLKMFRQLIYEKRKQQIMREALKDKKSEQWKKDRLKLLKHCLDTKREMDYYWIDDTMYAFAEEREKNPKTILRKFLNDSNHVSPELSWNKNYTSYGKTLALSFIFDSELFAMFIDCSSREGFLQPKFKMEYHISHFGDIPNRRNYKLAKSEIFYYSKSTKVGPCLLVCGQKGKVLAKIKQEEDENETVPHIIGCDSLVKVTSNNRLWCWNDQNIKIDESLPPVTIVTSLECSVVVVSLRDQEYIRFVDIPSLESVSIKSVCDKKGLQISEDNLQIKASTVKVLTSCYRTGNDHSYQEVILGLDMNLVTLQIIQDPARSVQVIMTEVLPISGFPVEHKFVGERDGYLLSWTQMDESSNEYKEHLSYFSRDSELLGVLPCLGRGPRSFYLVYLLGDADTQKDYPGYGLPGWYVYMRDGYDGIIALKLPTCVRTS